MLNAINLCRVQKHQLVLVTPRDDYVVFVTEYCKLRGIRMSERLISIVAFDMNAYAEGLDHFFFGINLSRLSERALCPPVESSVRPSLS